MWPLFLWLAPTEIPLPNEQARLEIIKIHASNISKHGEIGKDNDSSEFHALDVWIKKFMIVIFRLGGCC